MRKLRQISGLACVVLAGLFAFTGEALANPRPNIVLVQVDDMPRSLLGPVLADGRPAMPRLQSLITDQGASFRNHYNSTPLCSPSRSALLSGQYGRNSSVVGNKGEFGGWPGWQGREIIDRNLATMLQDGGYHTAHFGKFLNRYDRQSIWPRPLDIPPGWNTWVTDATDQSTRSFYGYSQLVRIERNGEVVEGDAQGDMQGPFGDPFYTATRDIDPAGCRINTPEVRGVICNHHTDRMTRLAADEIREVDRPLFLQVDYHAPHADNTLPPGPQPATRHLGKARNVTLPRGPSFNERNTSDKAFLVKRTNGPLRPERERMIEGIFRKELESLRAVDEGIGYLVQTLEETGKLDNTYFIFLSDNGGFHGQHRFSWGKFLPYESASRIPLVIRGPGIARARIPDLVNTTDLAPTVLEVAGVETAPGYEMDGRSLLPAARGNIQGTRARALLIENVSAREMMGEELPKIEPYRLDPDRPQDKAPALPFRALRIGQHKFIRYTQGGEELYDLRRDPHELYNQARNPAYRELLVYMRQMLRQYRDCSGAECLERPAPAPTPGPFRLDARRPPLLIRPQVSYLYKDAVYAALECRSKRPCRKSVSAHYRGERVTGWVNVRIRAKGRQRVILPAMPEGVVKLQRASEREARIELRRPTPTGSAGNNTLVARPVLRQN